MTTLELRTQIMQDIGNEQSDDILEKVQAYYRKLEKAEKKRPCIMTVDELKQDISQALDDIKNGRVTSQEQLLKGIETW